MAGKKSSVAKYKTICDAAEAGSMSVAQQFSIFVQDKKNSFLGHMLATLAKVCVESRARQYHATSSALHLGLSRFGHNLQAQLGNMIPLSEFDEEQQKHRRS